MGGVDKDDDIDDALAKAQKHLRFLKAAISEQSKHNFVLEKDVRYLDTRIALIIQNKMGVEEQKDIASRLDEHEAISETSFPDRKRRIYTRISSFCCNQNPNILHLCVLWSV